jgi:hypothetical protein
MMRQRQASGTAALVETLHHRWTLDVLAAMVKRGYPTLFHYKGGG